MSAIPDILLEAFRAAVLITGLVVIMMMLIESLNIGSGGRFFRRLQGSRLGQIVVSALLGWIPGCMGGFASISLFSHGMISFGALVAMMIATAGDEAFVMLTLFPGKALLISAVTLAVGIVAGVLIDYAAPRLGIKPYALKACGELHLHEEDAPRRHDHDHKPGRSFSWKRAVLFVGTAVFIAALALGLLGDAEEDAGHGLGLLSERWMYMVFAGLSVVLLAVAVFGSDHFVEEHLWHHVVARHVPGIFAWTFGVLVLLGFITQVIDISSWISANVPLMILLATLIGIIPESGPHLVFVTLFASGVIPAPVLLASCISQDGHASLPLLAESKGAFLRAKAVNCVAALVVGFASWAIMM
ncbi:MAG: arsenic efflux protein [Bacteroidales bacterium]|nr:arsenic efflux protein [Bacteroidales bacterium]